MVGKSVYCVCSGMAAQTTDRLWSSTQALGARHGQVTAATAAPPHAREAAGRCRCCPYGYHIDVDFLDYLNTVKSGAGLTKLKKIHGHRLRQRQAMETRLLMVRPPTTAGSTPPPSGPAWTEAGSEESSGSSSPVMACGSQSEDERDHAAGSLLMADLDASIADALDSIEALMSPRRRPSGHDNSETAAAAAGARSVSTGDVRRYPIEGHASAASESSSPRDPPSPLSTVSCSSLLDDISQVFQSTSSQPLGVENNDSSPPSATDVELRQRSETTSVSATTAAVVHESPKSTVPVPDGKSRSAPRPPPVKPRSTTGVDRAREDSAQEARTAAVSGRSADDASSGAVRRLPAVPHPAGEVPRPRDPGADQRQAASPPTTADSTVHARTASTTSTSTASGSADVITSGRQLPVPPKPTERETTSTTASRESSFSSVRALLSRKAGGTQRAGAAKVERPVRRSRQPVKESVETTTSGGDVTSALVLQNEAASESDLGMTTDDHRRLQTGETDSAAGTTATPVQAENRELAAVCSAVEVEATRPLRSGQVDDDSLQVSLDELTKAMAMLSPGEERPDDGATLDRQGPRSVDPDVLLKIRRYIASSLQQMRAMEQQVRLVPVLQLRVSVLKEEKRLLKLQLQSAKPSTTSDARVDVTPSRLPAAETQIQLDRRLPERSLVERCDVGVGDTCVETDSDATLYCQRCKAALRPQLLRRSSSSEPEEKEPARVQKSESEPETVDKRHGRDNKDPVSTQRSWSSSDADDVEMSAVAARTPDASSATRRQKPPVPHKEISVRREEWKNQTTVGIQCTLLKDSTEILQETTPEILTSERDTASMAVERADFRAQEPDLVITHGLAGSQQNEHQFRPAAAYVPQMTFVDKETATDSTSLRSAAVNTDTLPETSFIISSVDARGPAQTIDCAVNTDISGSPWSDHVVLTAAEHATTSKSKCAQSEPSSEPEFHQQMAQQTTLASAVGLGSEDVTKDSTMIHGVVQFPTAVPQVAVCNGGMNFVRSVKDASCLVDIVTKPVTTDASSCTDDSLLNSLISDASKLNYAAEAKPLVKDAECSADLTTKPSLVTTACNTETSVDTSLFAHVKDRRHSDTAEASCQADIERKPTTREVACGNDHRSPLDQPELLESHVGRSAVSHPIDVACGTDGTPVILTTSVRDVSCNTEVEPKKDISCLVDLKLSVCDKSCMTNLDGATGNETGLFKDSACLTDSLTTIEASSSSQADFSERVSVSSRSAGARPACVEAACMTDIAWRPSTRETGCSTDDVEVTALPSAAEGDASGNEDAKPPSSSVETNTDAWLLTSDITFLHSLTQILRPSVTETASGTENLQTADASTSCVREHTSDRSTSTDSEDQRAPVDVGSLARPAVCEAGSNTDAAVDDWRQVRNAASSVDVDVRASTGAAAAESLPWKPGRSVASNTDTTIHPFAPATASLISSSGNADALSSLKDAASVTDGPGTRHVSVATDGALKPLSVDAATQIYSEPPALAASEQRDETARSDAGCSTDAVQQRHQEVTAKAETVEVACDASLKPSLRSSARGIDAEIVHDEADCDAPVFQETRETACNTDDTVLSRWLDDPSRFATDDAALEDDSAISAVYRTDDQGAAVCRFCGIQRAVNPTERSSDGVTYTVDSAAQSKRTEASLSGFVARQSRASERIAVEESDVMRNDATVDDGGATDWRRTKVQTKDVACDTGRILTANSAINTDFSVELSAAKHPAASGTVGGTESHLEVGHHISSTKDVASMTDSFQQPDSDVLTKTAEDVACDTSDMILPAPEEIRESDTAGRVVETAIQRKFVAETSVVQDMRAIADQESTVTVCPACLAKPNTRDSSCETDSSSLSGDLRHVGAADGVEFTAARRTVCEVGCNTDWSSAVPTTAEAECGTTTDTRDVGSNTDATDVARKPTRIPQKIAAAAGRSGSPVARAVVKDAFCITDIAIAPSDDDAVLRREERRRAVASTSEAACNTDATEVVDATASGVEKRQVRDVGCGADLGATRDAGCTARPQTRSRSCGTEPAPATAAETPVKAERTRTGLQVTRKTTRVRVTDTSADVTTPEPRPAAATVAKSPTFDVACGTDLEFHSKYFDAADDGGLLRQLSADDVVEILRRRGDVASQSSSSLSSPTCDVACNTEHDSRPCTPARVANYSRYYALAAVEPPPPTSVDVACGPDGPATTALGGAEVPATPVQTSPDPPRDGDGPVAESADRTAEDAAADERQPEAERRRSPEMVDASVATELRPLSQDQACDTSDLTASTNRRTFLPATNDVDETTPKPEMKVGDHGTKPSLQLSITITGRDVSQTAIGR